MRYVFSRPVARQLSSACMCLTSVFGMAASPSAASGGASEGAACAAVGKMQACFVRRSICRAPQTETGGPTCSHSFFCKTKEKPPLESGGFSVCVTYFHSQSPGNYACVHVLNFCVRDGREPERRQRRSKRGRSVCSGRQDASLLRQARHLPGTANGNGWTHLFSFFLL